MSRPFRARRRAGVGRMGFKAFSMRRTRPRFRKVPQRAFRFNGQRRTVNPRSGGFIGIELKFYDQKLIADSITGPTDASGGEVDPSATVLLNTVVQGDGESNRIGRKMTMKSIYVVGQVNIGALAAQSGANDGTVVFIALVLDTQTNGATINSEDVYINPGANIITAATPIRNLQFTKQFKVLATRKFSIQQPNMTNDTGATGDVIIGGATRQFKIYKKLNHEVNFSGTTETVANIIDNSLHMIAYTSSLTQVPKISYNSRLRFMG